MAFVCAYMYYLNILNSHRMNFIKPCKHIHIYQTNINIKTVKGRSNSILSLICPFVILNGFCRCRCLVGLCELRHFFLHVFIRGYDCAMISHTQLFLWSRYSNIISLLTISLRGGGGGGGGSNKHCLLPFFHCYIDSTVTLFWKSNLGLVGNAEDRFSGDGAHIVYFYISAPGSRDAPTAK